MDKRGMGAIPLRMLISLVVGAGIVAVVFVGLRGALHTAAEKQVERECHEILSSLSTMVASGDARWASNPEMARGDTRSMEITMPDELVFLGFGIDPDPDNDGVLSSGLTANGSCIFFKTEGRGKRAIWDTGGVRFREGTQENGRWAVHEPQQGYIIRGGGTYHLTFELVADYDGTTYVLIWAQDKIAPT
ncbi:MAG: hypothetical protein PHU95_02715 [Candidatus Thermoplasmatota archaeon]|nr:hypothetical protein [Candidatus Thermoplasmatota archaeon]MDD5778344.1 hypothetical protein [Candidatus Thermoplasmatota archaeon]